MWLGSYLWPAVLNYFPFSPITFLLASPSSEALPTGKLQEFNMFLTSFTCFYNLYQFNFSFQVYISHFMTHYIVSVIKNKQTCFLSYVSCSDYWLVTCGELSFAAV